MITCLAERWRDYIDELRPLASEHYAEIGGYGADFEEAIEWERYRAYDACGLLISVILRLDGRIVGYFGGLLMPDPHSSVKGKRVVGLPQMLIWIHPKHRARYARRLIAAIELEARVRGASWIELDAVTGKNRAGDFYEALGYKPTRQTYVKVLADDRPDRSDSSVSRNGLAELAAQGRAAE